MDLSKLKHPAWSGIVLPLALAIGATFTPGTVRAALLIAAIVAVASTYHHTEHGGKRWKRTGAVAGVCLAIAIGVFFLGRVVDARSKPKETAAIGNPGPIPIPPARVAGSTAMSSATDKPHVPVRQIRKAEEQAKTGTPANAIPEVAAPAPKPPDIKVENSPCAVIQNGNGNTASPNCGTSLAKVKITPADNNKENTTAVGIGGPPHLETLYRSSFKLNVSESTLSDLRVVVRGEKLRQIECGQETGFYKAATAMKGVASCTMNNLFGDDWFFAVQTLSPISRGDLHMDIICSPQCKQ